MEYFILSILVIVAAFLSVIFSIHSHLFWQT